jgi:SAM-dependent methyltransferase
MIRKNIDSDVSQKRFWDKGGIFRNYNHPIMEYFITQRIRFLRKFINIDKIQTALDIGCGNGSAAYYFSKNIPFLIAGDYALDRHGFPQSNFKTLYFNAYHLPFKDKSFDLVYIWEVLHHLTDLDRTIAEAIRVAQKYIVIIEPNPVNPVQFIYSYAEKNHHLIRQCTKKRIIASLYHSGCKKIRMTSGGVIFPNKLPLIFFQLLKNIPYKIPVLWNFKHIYRISLNG